MTGSASVGEAVVTKDGVEIVTMAGSATVGTTVGTTVVIVNC